MVQRMVQQVVKGQDHHLGRNHQSHLPHLVGRISFQTQPARTTVSATLEKKDYRVEWGVPAVRLSSAEQSGGRGELVGHVPPSHAHSG